MKKVVLTIPDKDYPALLKLIRNNFQHIRIQEKTLQEYSKNESDDDTLEVMLLSEPGLAEDWLSDEDKRWDEVLTQEEVPKGC